MTEPTNSPHFTRVLYVGASAALAAFGAALFVYAIHLRVRGALLITAAAPLLLGVALTGAALRERRTGAPARSALLPVVLLAAAALLWIVFTRSP